MKIIRKGHKFGLESFDNKEEFQSIQFIEKVKRSEHPSHIIGTDDPNDLVTLFNGTTNEEVLAMLINRMYYLQEKFPCRENSIVIKNLEESLMWLNKRTEDRKKRNVEGKSLK